MHIIRSVTLSILAIACVAVSHGQAPKTPVKKTTATQVKPTTPVTKPPVKAAIARVRITTDMGEIIVKLSDKTPLHRDNFIKLVNEHFYDSLLFHRIIAGFMIQGGDPESKNALPEVMLGSGGVGYTIPAEFDSTLYHKKGALAAARTNNAEKASSGCQFYIVQGKKYGDDELNMIELEKGINFSPAKRMTYKMLGGTPKLDMNYTVFGEVESGIEIVDQIAQAQKDNNNRPLTDIRMKMEIIK
jgi:cyclophilin family peptidyl-prolyl cis-trans isomerase